MTKDASPPTITQLPLFPPHRPIIGLDHGSKTLGIAISDTLHMIASPLTTIRKKKFSVDSQLLLNIIEEHYIGGIVIGLPLNMDGSQGPRVQSVKAFVRNLEPLACLPTGYQDERLSTIAAERAMIEGDLSRQRRAQIIDRMSATIILQSALDRLRARP